MVRRENKPFAIMAIAGAALMVLHPFLADSGWWPQWLGADATADTAYVIALMLLVLAGLGSMALGEMRSRTNTAFSETEKWPYNPAKDLVSRIAGMGIMPVGGFNAFGVSTEGREAVIVGPADAFSPWGPHLQLLGQTSEIALEELDEPVRRHLRRRGLANIPLRLVHAPSYVETRRLDHQWQIIEKATKNRMEDVLIQANHTTEFALGQKVRRLAHHVEGGSRFKGAVYQLMRKENDNDQERGG